MFNRGNIKPISEGTAYQTERRSPLVQEHLAVWSAVGHQVNAFTELEPCGLPKGQNIETIRADAIDTMQWKAKSHLSNCWFLPEVSVSYCRRKSGSVPGGTHLVLVSKSSACLPGKCSSFCLDFRAVLQGSIYAIGNDQLWKSGFETCGLARWLGSPGLSS